VFIGNVNITMPNLNQDIFDRIVQHSADVRLYEQSGNVLIRKATERHSGRLKDLLKSDINYNVSPEVSRYATELFHIGDQHLSDYKDASVSFHSNNLYKATKGWYDVKRPSLVNEVIGPNINTSESTKSFFNRIGDAELKRINSIVSSGLAEGIPRDTIIDRVVNTTKMSQSQATALVTTSMTRINSLAVSKLMDANKDIVYGYRFTAILDSRTSSVCRGHDGELYTADNIKYRPPLHWRCRSTIVPVLKKSVDLKKVNGKAPDGVDPEIVKESYSDWLKRQPMDVKTRFLGSESNVSLFESGRLKANEFVNDLGKAISVPFLRRLDNARTSIGIGVTQDMPEGSLIAKLKEYRKPYDIMKSSDGRRALEELYVSDSGAPNQVLSMVDYRGVTAEGKRTARNRMTSEFNQVDNPENPFTGDVQAKFQYAPDYNVLQERLDYLKASKLLSAEQKTFIDDFVLSLEDKVSTNQQSAIVENLRVTFERYQKDKSKKWDDLPLQLRSEMKFSSLNVSDIIDRRAKSRTDIWGEDSKVNIGETYYDFDTLATENIKIHKKIKEWPEKEGAKLAFQALYTGKAPMLSYLMDPFKLPDAKAINSWFERNVPGLKLSREILREGLTERTARAYQEEVRRLLDTELSVKLPLDSKVKLKLFDGEIKFKSELFEISKKARAAIVDKTDKSRAVDVIANAFKLAADGKSTDYDTLAINMGKHVNKNWFLGNIGSTLQDHHEAGSKLLTMMQENGMIRVTKRGKVRRGVIDVDTGRASGGWGDTLSREVEIIDPTLKELQVWNRRAVIAERIGIVRPEDRFVVVPGKKTYFDTRGNDTGISIITKRASGNYDKLLVDRDFADMLNHAMDTKYEVDPVFGNFMDDVVRFRDDRGNVKKYDELNKFRKLIIQRGDSGYGLMQTVKWHAQRGKPFTVLAQIDGRGRVYHTGYLAPTGGEVVRPFLNSSVSRQFGPTESKELMTQIGALLGPATEALTVEGRMQIFRDNEALVRSLGNIQLETTQRSRRIREFLEHPLIQSHDAEEISKVARLSLEYARVHRHTKGDLLNPNACKGFTSKLMIENDASSSGAQIIGLSTGDRAISVNSNVLATHKKNRLYDLVAMDTAADPELHQLRAFRDAGITWEDLAKAAKAQNMVSFYGAGANTQATNIEAKFSKVMEKKGFLVITKDELKVVLDEVALKRKNADYIGATEVVKQMDKFKKELIETLNNATTPDRELVKAAADIHPYATEFVEKLNNQRKGLVGPADFKAVSTIMSKHLAARAPVTGKFVQFWKLASKKFIVDSEKVDIPWVTFDKKVLYQRYRPTVQERISFIDPVTGRRVMNIYEDSKTDGVLQGASSITNASIAFGVNGNHMNDASIVRMFHLWGKRNNVPTATIHDAFFTNIGDVAASKQALREAYATAAESNTIKNTLAQMRKEGLSEASYRELLDKARQDGLIDLPNRITSKDVLAPIPKGMDWYGIGP
jgi:SPP1 gp7 family putative phage head morphogenesis protein